MCSKEPSHRDGSFECTQCMFWLRNKKNSWNLPPPPSGGLSDTLPLLFFRFNKIIEVLEKNYKTHCSVNNIVSMKLTFKNQKSNTCYSVVARAQDCGIPKILPLVSLKNMARAGLWVCL